MENQKDFNPTIKRLKFHFEGVKSRMEKWRDSQTKGRWSKYSDDTNALGQKADHQVCYLVELTRALNQHNSICPPGEEWSIHEWFNRWISCADGMYFVTVARLRTNSRPTRTRVFLGGTLVSRAQYRKDITLSSVRSLINEVIMRLVVVKEPRKDLSYILGNVMSPKEKKDGADKVMPSKDDTGKVMPLKDVAVKIKTEIELQGLTYEIFNLFLRRLESWTRRLDSMKSLAERASEECGNWMEYFLHSGCSPIDFYQENWSYAPNGFYGMFRRPLC